jgi:hypothetical protein
VSSVAFAVLAIPALDLSQTDDGAAAKGSKTREFTTRDKRLRRGREWTAAVAVRLSQPVQPRWTSSNRRSNKQQTVDAGGPRAGATAERSSNRAVPRHTRFRSPAADARTDMQNTADVRQPARRQRRGHRLPGKVEERAVRRRDRDARQHAARMVLPKATAGQGMSASVGGATASYRSGGPDLEQLAGHRLVLLSRSSSHDVRSLLVPLKAVILNMLRCAAFGVVSFIFTHDSTAAARGSTGRYRSSRMSR